MTTMNEQPSGSGTELSMPLLSMKSSKPSPAPEPPAPDVLSQLAALGLPANVTETLAKVVRDAQAAEATAPQAPRVLTAAERRAILLAEAEDHARALEGPRSAAARREAAEEAVRRAMAERDRVFAETDDDGSTLYCARRDERWARLRAGAPFAEAAAAELEHDSHRLEVSGRRIMLGHPPRETLVSNAASVRARSVAMRELAQRVRASMVKGPWTDEAGFRVWLDAEIKKLPGLDVVDNLVRRARLQADGPEAA